MFIATPYFAEMMLASQKKPEPLAPNDNPRLAHQDSERGKMQRLFSGDESGLLRYQARLRGIEQRWDGYQRDAWRRKHGYTAWHMIINAPDPSRYLS